MHGQLLGNPLACAAAQTPAAILESGDWRHQVAAIEGQLREQLAPPVTPKWLPILRVLGAIGVVEPLVR